MTSNYAEALNELLTKHQDTDLEMPIHSYIRDNLHNPSNFEISDEDQAILPPAIARRIYLAIRALHTYPYLRDDLTELAISFSLCPLHFCDWAICFDDQDPTCDQIRAIYPNSHDT